MENGAPFRAIEIEINHACNRRCSYCPNSIAERSNKGEIELDLLEKVLKELRAFNYSGRVSYDFFNEPTLHSNFKVILEMTRQALPLASIELYSNGTQLDSRSLTCLFEAGLSKAVITCHEGENEFSYAERFSKLPLMWRDRLTLRRYQDLKLTNRGGILRHLGDGLALTPCHISAFLLVVTVSGNVLPCFEDFHENLVMGNVRDQTLMEIWASHRYQSFRAHLKNGLRHLYPPCRGCNRTEVLPPVRCATDGDSLASDIEAGAVRLF